MTDTRERDEQKRESAKWLAGLVQITTISADGTERVLEGDETVQAILRQWDEADE